MTAFSLFTLNEILLEKVIIKFEGRSYSRFQQTCRKAYLIIRKIRNISVYTEGEFNLKYRKVPSRYAIEEGVNVKGLYKTRLNTLHAPDFEGSRDFDLFCDAITEYKITCAKLRIRNPTYHNGYALTTEECAALITRVKPVEVYLDSERSGGYEALLNSNSNILKNVEVCLYQKEADRALPQFLSSFEKVRIRVYERDHNKDRLDTLRVVLRVLFSKPYPNLREFTFAVNWRGPLPSKDQAEEKLRDYGFHGFVVKKQTESFLCGRLNLPPLLSAGDYINLTIDTRIALLDLQC